MTEASDPNMSPTDDHLGSVTDMPEPTDEAEGPEVSSGSADDSESHMDTDTVAASDLVSAPEPEHTPEPDPIATAIDALRGSVDKFHERSRADEEVIARMQTRIEALQADQVRALLGPVVTELAALHANISDAAGRDYGDATAEQVHKEFSFLASRVENALDLLGVTSLEAKQGDQFDSRRHQALRQVPTDDPALDATIATVQRQGFVFEHQGKPAIYARVTVYSHDAALHPTTDQEETPTDG